MNITNYCLVLRLTYLRGIVGAALWGVRTCLILLRRASLILRWIRYWSSFINLISLICLICLVRLSSLVCGDSLISLVILRSIIRLRVIVSFNDNCDVITSY